MSNHTLTKERLNLLVGYSKVHSFHYFLHSCMTHSTLSTNTHRRALCNWEHRNQGRVNHTLIDHIMMWSPCVQVAHRILEQVFQRSRASSSSSAEQPQPTGSSPGVHLEPSGKLVQARWAQRQKEGGHRLCLQDLPSLGGCWG